MTTPCPRLHHSPTLSGGKWRCDDCANNVTASPLSRLHAAIERRNTDSEWSLFVAALRQAAGPGGFVSQTNVRPLIQAIPHKTRGRLYSRAIKAGVLKPVGYEPSTDVKGKNAGRPQTTYHLNERSAA